MSVWKPVLAALVIFAAGVFTGAFAARIQRAPWRRPTTEIPAPTTMRPARAEGLEPGALRPALQHPAETQLRELSQRMARHLDLTPQQREQVQLTIRNAQMEMRAIAEEMAPKTRESFRHMRERIRAELTPAQRQKFEELCKAREGRLRRTNAIPTAPSGQ